MKFIILEGPSTSGKTTVAKKLVEKLTAQGFGVKFLSEEETLMPILASKNSTQHKNHLMQLLKDISGKNDYVVTDRFHLTSAAVTEADLESFEEIENELLKYDTEIIFLKIDSDKLGERIFEAMKHRGPSWQDHVKSKGSKADIIDWYLKTQVNLLKYLSQSKLKNRVIDATESDYDKISDEITRTR